MSRYHSPLFAGARLSVTSNVLMAFNTNEISAIRGLKNIIEQRLNHSTIHLLHMLVLLYTKNSIITMYIIWGEM